MPRQKKQYKHLNQVRYQGTPIANNTTPETANIVDISELPIDTNAVSENDNAINIAELSESNVLSESTNTIDVPESNTTSETDIVEISESPTDTNAISENNNVINIAELSESNVLSDSTNTINVPESNIEISKNTIRLERKRAQLIDQIKLLPDDEVAAACHLFETMRYSSGNRKAKIFSPYIINKAKTFIVEGLSKHYSSITAIQSKINLLEKENRKLRREKEIAESQVHSLKMKVIKGEGAKARYISKIRSINQKGKKISPEQFKREAEKLIRVNKREYTPQFVQLVTELSNTGIVSISSTVECTKKMYAFLTGEKPDKWLSTGTVSRWNQEIARLFTCENLSIDREARFFTYGVMADESTRGEKKVFLVCFAYWNNKKSRC